jgi:hypothetical protein
MVVSAMPPRPRAALVSGVATAVHYALPDLIPSRTARGWAKAGLTAVSVAAAAPELRAAWALAREGLVLGGESRRSPKVSPLSGRNKAAALAPVTAVLACSVGLLLTAERWIFRRGQARAAAGKRLPHTGPALLYGVLAGGLWLLPAPAEKQ